MRVAFSKNALTDTYNVVDFSLYLCFFFITSKTKQTRIGWGEGGGGRGAIGRGGVEPNLLLQAWASCRYLPSSTINF